jgi:hypothetical protein
MDPAFVVLKVNFHSSSDTGDSKGAADDAVLNKVHKNIRNNLLNFHFGYNTDPCGGESGSEILQNEGGN